MQKYYDVFHRTWWIKNFTWPGGREPEIGQRHYIKKHVVYVEARELCKKWNASHKPGELSDKAEFEESEG